MGEAASQEAVALSAGTKAVLQRLDSPIEIRFYALLDHGQRARFLPAFVGRVDQLLSAYQEAAHGKITVIATAAGRISTRAGPRRTASSRSTSTKAMLVTWVLP